MISDYPSGITTRDHVWWNIFHNYAPGGHHAPTPYADSRQYDAIRPNPDIIFNCDWFDRASRVDSFFHVGEREVVSAAVEDLRVRSYQAVTPYAYSPESVDTRTVYPRVFANGDLSASLGK